MWAAVRGRVQGKGAGEKPLQGETSSSASEWTKCRANVVHERKAPSEDMRSRFHDAMCSLSLLLPVRVL